MGVFVAGDRGYVRAVLVPRRRADGREAGGK